jgi:hypothetical protein
MSPELSLGQAPRLSIAITMFPSEIFGMTPPLWRCSSRQPASQVNRKASKIESAHSNTAEPLANRKAL